MCRKLAVVVLFFGLCCLGQVAETPTTTLQAALSTTFGTKPVADVRIEGNAVAHFGVDDTGSFIFEGTSAGRSKLVLGMSKNVRTELMAGAEEPAACSWSTTDGEKSPESSHNCWVPGNSLFPLLTFADTKTTWSIAAGSKSGTVSFTRNLGSKSTKTNQAVSRLSYSEIEFDPMTRLPTILRFTTHPEDDYGTDIPVEIRFSDYKPFDGVQVPTRIVKTMNGSTVLELTVSNVTFNTGTKAQ